MRVAIPLFVLLFLSFTNAWCAKITVTNTNDSGAGSLRDAISDASSGDEIDFAVTGTITLTTDELSIAKNITISGPGSEILTIDGNGTYRIFKIESGYTVNISGLKIENGSSATYGGGIENEATLNLTDCVITGCSANGGGNGYGGGLDNYGGTVTITRCTFNNNSANNEGGAIAGSDGSIMIIDSTIDNNTSDNGSGISQLNSATLELIRCTVSGNYANDGSNKNGGGIICKAGTLTLTNCTISGNVAANGGGIIDGTSSASTITITNCTIVNNTADTRGGGIEFNKSTANIKNTILASNNAPTDNNFHNSGSGDLNSQGYNLCDGDLSAFSGTGDQTNATLNIDTLADNGGNTQTHGLLSGSAAIDAIPEGGNAYNGSPAVDQRGASRPQGTNADVGAFEVYQAPTVTTEAVSSISAITSTGNGTITDMGASNPTAHGFCWSTSVGPTTADSHTDEGPASSTGAFTSEISGLTAYTTYYVRAYATNSVGTGYGAQVSFTTDPVLPSLTTQAVGSITSTTATGNGNITDLGTPSPTAHGICWNTAGTPTTGDFVVNNGAASSTGAFTANITSLSPHTTYYVRAFATNPGGTVYGDQVSFVTNPVAPTVTSQAVSAITTTTATGNGNITDLGAPDPTSHGMCWNIEVNPTTSDSCTNEGSAVSTGAFTSDITGLSAYTTYYVRAYAANTGGASYGAQVSFTTQGIVPTVTTRAVSAIAATTATGGGDIASLGVPNPTAHGICWNITGTPTTSDTTSHHGSASSTGVFTSPMTGLSHGTTYYVRAYATNAQGTSYGAQVSFTTTETPPSVSTQTVSAIGATTATGNGNINDLGSVNPTAHGVCWNISGNPTTADSRTNEGGAFSTGAFTSHITGLDAYTTYYVRAYATNTGGTSYGAQDSFTTLPALPTVTTQTVTAIAETAATGHGNITALGAPNPTAHGVCWNTDGNPTISDSRTNEGATSATGAYASNITGLSADTVYHVRAYAINPAGTAYGSEVSFQTARGSLSVSISGSGSGQVSSSPEGIDCGADCSETYDRDTIVRLTAIPGDCSSFTGWSGACSGTESCVVAMSRTQNVTATFNMTDTDEDQQPDCEDTDDDNDGMPDEWEIQNDLDPLDPDDACLDPDGDGLDNLGEYLNGSHPEEQTEGPGIPLLISPEDGAAGVPLEPELTADYLNPALSDTHYATRWQIAEDPLFEDILFDIVSDIHLTAVSVPRLIMDNGKTCYFRACYHNYNNIAWMWSDTRSFTTTSDSFADQNGNGTPDDQDLPEGTAIDLDANGINDPEQDGMKCVRLSDDETMICCQCTENIRQMEFFRRMDDTAAQLETGIGLDLPFGLFGFRAFLENPEQPAVVTVFSSKPFAEDARWLKYDSVGGHRDFSDNAQFSPDKMSVRLTFIDGGSGDADGCANGVIVDPSGPEESASTDNPGSSGSGGGRCFIQSVFEIKPYE